MVTLPRFAMLGYAAVKHQVDCFDKWPAWQKVRRGFQAPVYRFADTGLLGLRPLRTHILICGFPAAGTTLLQLMLENGLPHARRFGKERSGWRAATYSFRNHAIMISKQPRDIFRLEPLRQFYSTRPARLKIIMMQRDPRDLLTAERKSDGQIKYVGVAKDWKGYYTYFQQHQDDPDVFVLKYEDLVADVAKQQCLIETFVEERMQLPFEQFDSVKRSDFATKTLGGLRPLESTRVARWQEPRHRQRIIQMLHELPDLPDAVRQLGYETDDAWTDSYLQPAPEMAEPFSKAG
jgi:hypothetical protein